MSHELPNDRLATTDKEGHRLFLYPADVSGRFRNYRTWVQTILIVFFLVLPWIHIGGHPVLLLNIPQRKFSILGAVFWAHEVPLLFLLLAGGALTLGFVTAIWGRFWCGWACPQTVFIDGVFRRIERFVEGNSVERKKLDQGPWTEIKLFKKSVKWSIYLFVALIIAHSFLAYFVGTEQLAEMIRRSPKENFTSFLIMGFVTIAIAFDFGWFREQFCTILCPYGRFQSLLMDPHSMAIVYDAKRGEPRKGRPDAPKKNSEGDCINCYRCVQVCPTGVDIRRGVQMECIACTACIDACDTVMSRLGKAKGLIRYDNEISLSGGVKKNIRPRTILYSILILSAVVVLSALLVNRSSIQVELLRAKDTPYQEIVTDQSSPTIMNRFRVVVSNEGEETINLYLVPGEGMSELKLILPQGKITLGPSEKSATDLFVSFPKSLLQFGRFTGRIRLEFEKANQVKTFLKSEEVPLVGPFR